ncbi:PTS system nitrogen regulatory IIA component [Natronospira proteinivora]|uniref:PTS system nitrogen regulatory IIA component n=1 Tax=Natronospira proteinivora TaxID=1807133 RepID=A0ABT1G4Q7_9GAMM|nr:PTS IIA-like nitrogen regulatory protein PtsN [Natronospira proteinivora]MCP1726072.1 PTS system nitrogen regulatory IIA component [Natronospira proteinivora]
MKISDLIAPERIDAHTQAGGKKRALEILSELLAKDAQALNRGQVFSSMISRERLGSTAIGSGVAIPHGRIEGLNYSIGAFIRLDEPVDFDATDGGPVDMLFALLVPTHCAEEHLNALAALAQLFSQAEFCDRLRQADNAETVYELLIQADKDQTQASA